MNYLKMQRVGVCSLRELEPFENTGMNELVHKLAHRC